MAQPASPSEGAPVLSVVVPLLDAEDHLEDQLRALTAQSYAEPWELILAENGSTDGTARIVREWQARDPRLRLVDASRRRGAAAARNAGVRAARGRVVVFCDADDVVAPGWLAAMAAALERHDVVAGAVDVTSLDPGALPAPPRCLGAKALGYRPMASAVNMGVTRSVFESAGGFDEDLLTGEDPDLSWRLHESGFEIHFEPAAVVAKRQRTEPGEMWRQHVAVGMSEVALFKRWRHRGMPRRSPRAVIGDYLFLLARLARIRRRQGRLKWMRDVARRWGRIRGSLREGVVYL